MKKVYETPNAEKIEFQYRDQVVVASSVCSITNERVGFTCKPESNPTFNS